MFKKAFKPNLIFMIALLGQSAWAQIAQDQKSNMNALNKLNITFFSAQKFNLKDQKKSDSFMKFLFKQSRPSSSLLSQTEIKNILDSVNIKRKIGIINEEVVRHAVGIYNDRMALKELQEFEAGLQSDLIKLTMKKNAVDQLFINAVSDEDLKYYGQQSAALADRQKALINLINDRTTDGANTKSQLQAAIKLAHEARSLETKSAYDPSQARPAFPTSPSSGSVKNDHSFLQSSLHSSLSFKIISVIENDEQTVDVKVQVRILSTPDASDLQTLKDKDLNVIIFEYGLNLKIISDAELKLIEGSEFN